MTASSATTPPRTPDESRRNPRVRDAILLAAVELVGELGWAKTTIEAIAARAGVGKQTIYRWWPSKGAVLLDGLLMDRSLEDSPPLPADLFGSGDLRRDLEQLLRALSHEFSTPSFEAPYRAVVIAMQSDPVLAELVRERIIGPSQAEVGRSIRVAQQAGTIRDDLDVAVAVDLIVAPVFQRWLLGLPLDDDHATAHAAAVTAALEPRPPA